MKVYGPLEVAQLEWFTNAGKPAAANYPFRVIYVTDRKQIQVSDGTNWIAESGQTFQERPTGSVNGSNVTFTLANTPIRAASVKLYLDGLFQFQTEAYTLSGTTITMSVAPAFGQDVLVVYEG